MTWIDVASVAGLVVQARCNGTTVQMALKSVDPGDSITTAGFTVVGANVLAWSQPSLNAQSSTALYQSITLSIAARSASVGRWIQVQAFASAVPSCYAVGTVSGA
jgi:hypothetical protein